MYLDPVPIPGKVRSVIVIRRIDAIHDILAELEAAGWFWNAGQYSTQYDPLTNCEAERRDQVSCVILDCFKRIITTTCYSEEETDHVLSQLGSGFRVYQINNDAPADCVDDDAVLAFLN